MLACGCALVGLLAAVGCARKASALSPPAPAQLVVINATDYAWRLTLTDVGGRETRREQISPRTQRTIGLQGGNYDVEQTVVPGNATPDLTRRISFRLQAGQTYRWRLATLLSGSPATLP